MGVDETVALGARDSIEGRRPRHVRLLGGVLGVVAVGRRRLPVLARVGPIGLGLEPVESRLGPLFGRRVAPHCSPMPCLEQVGPVRGRQVAVAPAPVAIHGGVAAVEGGVLQRDVTGRPVTQVSGKVPAPGRGVPMIGGKVSVDGPLQHAVHLGVPVGAGAVALVGHGVAPVGGTVAAVRRRISLVGDRVALVGRPLPLAQPSLPSLTSGARPDARPGGRTCAPVPAAQTYGDRLRCRGGAGAHPQGGDREPQGADRYGARQSGASHASPP